MAPSVFEMYESNVRSYCRRFDAVFATGDGHILVDEQGRRFIDFFSGAGALNYGHNNPAITRPIIDYIEKNGVLHSLDFYTSAKAKFISTFQRSILDSRGLEYKMQFTGPTGTNAIEAALKLARKYTGRSEVIAFTNAFHGMSLGSLAATTNPAMRAGAGVPLTQAVFMPYDNYFGEGVDTIDYLEAMLLRTGSGVDKPAAILVETVQGEGGLQTASRKWLQDLHTLCRKIGALLIVDDIQAGCGRTGTFFSFEPAEIEPDIVCLSKSLSGSGLPMSLVLLRPDIDVWTPGEHNGTFRGNNLGFIGATAAIETYWLTPELEHAVAQKANLMREMLDATVARLPRSAARVKGRGMFMGLEFDKPDLAVAVSEELYRHHVIAETCGPHDEVVKLLPSLTIPADELQRGLTALQNIAFDLVDCQRSAA